MASNSLGKIFKIHTWGESHGKAIGVVIDGCPSGIELTVNDINTALRLRSPGNNKFVSARKEPDLAEILSGVFQNKTTGAPISIIIYNKDYDSTVYEPIKDLIRPGHANYTYLEKYGIFDYRGGGRASARETACRVAAAAVAEKIIKYSNIKVSAYIKEIAGIECKNIDHSYNSQIFCLDSFAEKKIMSLLSNNTTDSFGGIVGCFVENMPIGLGDPIYDKLEANLAKSMLSIPASKAFEIGSGVNAARMLGSEHNDLMTDKDVFMTNNSGGILGGISNGMDLSFRVTFKPTSSIAKEQVTIDKDGNKAKFVLPKGSRHDPCLAIRAVPVVRAMCILVLADALLLNRLVRF